MNYHAWLQWTKEHYGALMFLLFLALVVYIPVGILAGYQILKLNTKDRLVFWIGILFIGIGLMGAFEMIANIDPPYCVEAGRHIHYSTWYAWWYWSGKVLLNIPVIVLWRHLQNPKSR